MEYVSRGSLFDLLHRSPALTLLVSQALWFARDIAEGMAFLHGTFMQWFMMMLNKYFRSCQYLTCQSYMSILHVYHPFFSFVFFSFFSFVLFFLFIYFKPASGVLHRDLKSANVLVDESSRPKICDFGLSKEENADAFTVSAPSVHGTIAWSPPETLRGQACTGASDVYSFGIILYELLTRKIPYRNLQMAEVVIGVLSASNLRPSMIGCEGVLGQDVMEKAWNVEPKTRPTFTQIVVDLDIVLQSNNDGLSRSVNIV